MSTTTDTADGHHLRLHPAVRFAGATAAVLAVWFVALAALTVTFEPEDTVLAFGPEQRLYRALASSETRLLASGPGFLRLRGGSTGFVAALYAGGAWLVLPGSAFGCGASPPLVPGLTDSPGTPPASDPLPKPNDAE